jgi:hypothetical protein
MPPPRLETTLRGPAGLGAHPERSNQVITGEFFYPSNSTLRIQREKA